MKKELVFHFLILYSSFRCFTFNKVTYWEVVNAIVIELTKYH